MRLVDADMLIKTVPTEEINARMAIATAPTIEAKPTFEQIEEYCRKRCLVVVDGALFNEMKSRWSAEPIKHGHWVFTPTTGRYRCSACGKEDKIIPWGRPPFAYCPNCGAKMDEVEE